MVMYYIIARGDDVEKLLVDGTSWTCIMGWKLGVCKRKMKWNGSFVKEVLRKWRKKWVRE